MIVVSGQSAREVSVHTFMCRFVEILLRYRPWQKHTETMVTNGGPSARRTSRLRRLSDNNGQSSASAAGEGAAVSSNTSSSATKSGTTKKRSRQSSSGNASAAKRMKTAVNEKETATKGAGKTSAKAKDTTMKGGGGQKQKQTPQSTERSKVKVKKEPKQNTAVKNSESAMDKSAAYAVSALGPAANSASEPSDEGIRRTISAEEMNLEASEKQIEDLLCDLVEGGTTDYLEHHFEGPKQDMVKGINSLLSKVSLVFGL